MNSTLNMKNIVTDKYSAQLTKIRSLVESIEIPSICLVGEDSRIVDLIIVYFIELYENGEFHIISNSNDYYEIDKQGEPIKIDDIRELIGFSTLRREKLKNKYTIIKNIESANVYAQNSLLKIIEEPSQETLFICTTNSYESLLNTIKSRLFRIDVPTKAVTGFRDQFSEELRWLARYSIDILEEFSPLDKQVQNRLLKQLREKSLKDLFFFYADACTEGRIDLDEDFSIASISGKSARKLYALIIVEKIIASILYKAQDINQMIFETKDIMSRRHKKSHASNTSATTFSGYFFKELFSTTQRVLYAILTFSVGNLAGSTGYTNLVTLCLEKKPKLNIDLYNSYMQFLERIKNMKQISLNAELLLTDYLMRTKKIFD